MDGCQTCEALRDGVDLAEATGAPYYLRDAAKRRLLSHMEESGHGLPQGIRLFQDVT